MAKYRYLLMISVALLATSTTGCGAVSRGDATATVPAATPTPDLCTPENLPAEVGKVNRLMREFDDISRVAGNLPQNSLYSAITDLQRVRRATEDLPVPACLGDLKKYQLAHMNAVINTLVGFMSSAPAENLNQGIAVARQLHDQYTLEMARLLGLTVVAPATFTPGAALTPTGAETAVVQATLPALPVVSNPGPNTINIRTQPALDAVTLGVLGIGLTATAAGKTIDEQWVLIEVPGTPGIYGWVYAPLIQLSVPMANLPVATPAP